MSLELSAVLLLASLSATSAAENATVSIVRPPDDAALAPEVIYDGSALHLVYGTPDKQAFYARSADLGATWSRPVRLNTAGLNVTTTMGERGPKLARGNNVLHAVWPDYWFPGALTYGRYARSTDGGATWSTPVAVTDAPGIDGLTVAASDLPGGCDVIAYWHGGAGDAAPANATAATWLHARTSADCGATWAPASFRVSVTGGMPAVSCSMCAMSSAFVGGQARLALRTAVDDVRTFFLLTASSGAARAYDAAPLSPGVAWPISYCPMNGPVLTHLPNGSGVVAFMTGDANDVFWSSAASGYARRSGTPSGKGNERYATAVEDPLTSRVLMVWNVGPMSVDGTARVEWAVYDGATGVFTGQGATAGTTTSGTKATALVVDGAFLVVTTAR